MSEYIGNSNTSGQERNELVRRELPDVSAKKKIKMLRVDGGQAHFIDSGGTPWYFNSEERLWREMTLGDIHPMATQFTAPEKPEKTVFDNVEDAALAALKVHFRQKAELYETVEDLQKYATQCRELVNLIEKIEKEPRPDKRAELKRQFTELLNKFEEGLKTEE